MICFRISAAIRFTHAHICTNSLYACAFQNICFWGDASPTLATIDNSSAVPKAMLAGSPRCASSAVIRALRSPAAAIAPTQWRAAHAVEPTICLTFRTDRVQHKSMHHFLSGGGSNTLFLYEYLKSIRFCVEQLATSSLWQSLCNMILWRGQRPLCLRNQPWTSPCVNCLWQ
jgi:hypothetical protein